MLSIHKFYIRNPSLFIGLTFDDGFWFGYISFKCFIILLRRNMIRVAT
jgi:hypothetical protein